MKPLKRKLFTFLARFSKKLHLQLAEQIDLTLNYQLKCDYKLKQLKPHWQREPIPTTKILQRDGIWLQLDHRYTTSTIQALEFLRLYMPADSKINE